MFGIKELKSKVAGYDQNIEMVARAINAYFQTNEKPNKDFEIETIGDKMVNFILSVDERLKELEKELTEKSYYLEVEQQKNEKLKAKNKELEAENAEKGATIIGYEQDVEYLKEKLAKAKTATAKGGKK